MNKKCNNCGVEKELELFAPKKNVCKSCCADKHKILVVCKWCGRSKKMERRGKAAGAEYCCNEHRTLAEAGIVYDPEIDLDYPHRPRKIPGNIPDGRGRWETKNLTPCKGLIPFQRKKGKSINK